MKRERPETSWPGAGIVLTRAILICALLAFLGMLPGCSLEEFQGKNGEKSDLLLAEEALQARDTGDAEMYFERYLRKNPTGVDRWEVWQELLSIALNMRQDMDTAREYLEIMLAEFYENASKRQDIQMRLADLCNQSRAYPRAVKLWEALIADEGLPVQNRAAVYRELSRAYLRRLEFSMATQMLGMCLQLEVPAPTKADCLYDLAEAQMLTDELKASEDSLRQLLLIENALPERRVLATFMLADVLEQQSRLDEAVTLYESIRETYPNTKVVEIRLSGLKGKKNSKPAPAAPRKK